MTKEPEWIRRHRGPTSVPHWPLGLLVGVVAGLVGVAVPVTGPGIVAASLVAAVVSGVFDLCPLVSKP